MRGDLAVTLPEGPDFIEGTWPEYNWWALFDDPQLSEIMEEAISDNPNLKASIFRLRTAEAEARKVRSLLFPKLGALFTDDYQHLSRDDLYRFPPSKVPAVVNEIRLGLDFEYEIDLFGKNRENYRAALGEAKAQSAEMSQSLLMITALLAESYFNYQMHQAQLEISQDLLLAHRANVELSLKRLEYGLDNQIALERAEAEMLSAEESVVTFEKEVLLNENQLKILMGLGPDDPRDFKIPTAKFDRPFPLPQNIPVDLLARRPDLQAKIWRVEAAAHLINVAKAAFYPNINLAAFAGLETLNWNNLFSASSLAASLAPAIHLPIFTGGKLTAQLSQKRAEYDAAVYDYNSLLLQATREVSDQLTIMQALSKQTLLQAKLLSKVIKSSDLTYARYENGLDNYLIVLNSQMDVMNEAIRDITIQNGRYLAILKLIKALGGGYHSEQ
ncbi:MAG: Toluene efflux pump outer membrane protein TtgF [Chlamydiae bacterium]|nr:Toluene efflux pump outer membrane protein TtgF [Chlamydiota bacterium]